MFYYLLYNSSFVNQQEKDYNIKLLIFGTISYIIVHSIIYSFKKLESIKNYFWLLLTLDITSVYFLINNKNNGKLNIISTSTNQDTNNSKNITNNNSENINKNNNSENINKNNIKTVLDNLKTKTTELEETQIQKESIKLEIKDTLISNDNEKKNNIVKTSFDSDSDDHGSDLDIDLEAFEQSLN